MFKVTPNPPRHRPHIPLRIHRFEKTPRGRRPRPRASAKTIAQDVAHLLPAPQRRALLGIAQLIMLGELAVNRVLDNLEVPG
jgi:hypothetical protein